MRYVLTFVYFGNNNVCGEFESLTGLLGPWCPFRFLEEMGVEEELRCDAARNQFGTHLRYLGLSIDR